MAKNNFILLSLDDDKAKKIANVLSNSSCKKILDYLTEKEATETQIATDLKLPISTVHYNLKQLLDIKLIEWEDSHYSEKGKQVKHYKLANKFIIIAPKNEQKSSILDKLKTLIPTFLFLILGGFFVNYLTNPKYESFSQEMIAYDTAPQAMMAKSTDLAIQTISEPTFWEIIKLNPAFWYIIGAISALLISMLVKYIIHKLSKK